MQTIYYKAQRLAQSQLEVMISRAPVELGAETGILNPTEKRARKPLKAEHSTHWVISSVVSSAA